MNKKAEATFVNTYIVKNRRERLLFELHGKKRSDAIQRFCHRADELLINTKIKWCGSDIWTEIEDKIRTSKVNTCYIISFFEDLDGKELPKQELMDTIIGRGMTSIALFDDFVVIETEQEQGPAIKYVLEK